MANIFGILTAVVLALAAFVAYKNKQAYGYELEHRKNEQVKLKASQDRLETARTNLAATQKQRSETETEVAKLKTEEAAQKKSNDDLKQQIETKKVTMDANKKQLDGIREKTAPFGEIKELAATVKALRTATEELKEGIATNEGKLANLSNENSRMEGEIQVLKNRNDMVSRRESYIARTRISSIYPSWGFVTLAAGTTSGVVSGSTLEVVRGGTTVAKLLVTAVESNTASASIVPDSLAQDTVLMVGDQVVAAHKAVEAPAKAPKKLEPLPTTPDEPAATPAPDAVPSLEDALGADPLADPAKPAAEPAKLRLNRRPNLRPNRPSRKPNPPSLKPERNFEPLIFQTLNPLQRNLHETNSLHRRHSRHGRCRLFLASERQQLQGPASATP